MSKYASDPRWITARFNSDCPCGQPIHKGEKIFYYPKGRKALCEKCGEKASAEFNSAAMDESFMSGEAW